MRLFIDEYHSLAEVVSLELLLLDLCFDGEADGLASHSLFYVDPLVMNALDLYWVELALLVWA